MENDYFITEGLNAFFQSLKNKKGYNYVFMNERFYELYRMFLLTDKNIELDGEICLYKNFKRKPFKKYIFINDINYELPEEIKKNDEVKIYIKLLSFRSSFVHRLGNLNNDEALNLSYEYNFSPPLLTGYVDYFVTSAKTVEVLSFLAAEINYLIECGFDNAVSFLPQPVAYYFIFIDKYFDEINAFIELYNNGIDAYRESIHSSRKSLSDVTEGRFIHKIIMELEENKELKIDEDFKKAFDKVPGEGYNSLNHELIDIKNNNKVKNIGTY